MMPPPRASAPPESPVPAPRPTSGISRLTASFTIFTTSAAMDGHTTTSGRAFSTDPSYSYSTRSSSRESTFRAPTIPSSSAMISRFKSVSSRVLLQQTPRMGSHRHYSNSQRHPQIPESSTRPVLPYLLRYDAIRTTMPKAKIFVTHPLYSEAQALLHSACDCEFWSKAERPPKDELLRRIKDKEGLVCLLTERVGDDTLRAAPKLRIVANVAVGYDNVDVPACTRRGVIVTNTPGVLDETTADFAWALMLAVARRVVEADQYVRAGNWQGWNFDQYCGTDVWGKTLGVVGFGRIGQAVARRAQGFAMKIIYNSRKRVAEDVEKQCNAEYRDLNALLAESDFISLHVPLSGDTRGLFDAPKFFRMKPTAFLVNTS